MAGKAVAIDVGSHSMKVMAVKAGKRGLAVTRFCAVPAGEGPGALAQAGIGLKGVVCGLAGRDMTLRYSQVPPTPDWQLRNLMDLEIQDLAQQSGGALSADFNLLPSQDPEAGTDTVLLALAREEALDKLQAQLAEAGGSATGFTPNCIAIYNAYLRAGPVEQDAVVCLANIGHETLDIALVKGVDLLFARNLSGGGKVLDDAIAAAFNVSERKAESLKRDLLDLDPQSRGKYASGQAEKVTVAAAGAASAITAGIQSSLAFCKSQTKIADLRLDKVLVCGGSARLRGLKGMLRESLRCPVELFDPFANLDLSALPAPEADQLQAMRQEAVVALGLAATRADDSLYALEIVPAAVRRRQRFGQRTIYNIAAAAIAVLLLVLESKQLKADEEVASAELNKVKRAISRDKKVHEDTDKLVQQNTIDRAMVEHLANLGAPLYGAVQTGRVVRDHLPPQMWLTKFEVAQKTPPGQTGGEKHPMVTVEGGSKGIDGMDAQDVRQNFANACRSDPRLKDRPIRNNTEGRVEATIKWSYTIDWAPHITAADAAADKPPDKPAPGKGGPAPKGGR
jgi:type IV pilus assembly protein PilM